MSSQLPDQSLVTHPLHVARQAALVGAGAAVPGLLIGATYGTLRTKTPFLFSLASGAQCFALGSTFWGIRTLLLHQDGIENWWRRTRGTPLVPRSDLAPSPSDRTFASTVSGASTGFILGFLLRGPRNVIPGTAMFALYGYLGQKSYNWLDDANTAAVLRAQKRKEQKEEKEPLLNKIAKSKWSPMSVLSDDEYEKLMGEKLLEVEVKIAVIDDKIKALKEMQQYQEAQKEAQIKQTSAQK